MQQDLTPGTRIDHTLYGEGLISKVNVTNYEVFFHKAGKTTISKDNDEIEVVEVLESAETAAATGGGGISLPEMEEVITHILEKYNALQEIVELGDSWEGGKMVLVPGKEGLQSKEIPIEAFFHKIVMMRDKLRVLEQNINSNNKLSDEEKVHLQQYITRCYGSMTTFNILFENKEDQFSTK